MKTVFIILLSLVVIVIALFFILGKVSQKGEAPGLVNGILSKCSDKPNCVSSEYPHDVKHFVEALSTDSIEMKKVVDTIKEMSGVVNVEESNYVAAIFTSSVFGFVDDFEIRIDNSQNAIHFRSASRVGYSDRGVNKKRVELFKSLYQKK